MAPKCIICGKEENLTGFPRNKEHFDKWVDILQLRGQIEYTKHPKYKLCIDHFDKKFHRILLNPIMRRSKYVIPSPPKPVFHPDGCRPVDKENTPDDFQFNAVFIKSEPGTEPVNVQLKKENADKFTQTQQEPNYELMIQMRDHTIQSLKKQALQLQKENLELENILKVRERQNLNPNAKFLVDVILEGKTSYTTEQKEFFLDLYRAHPSSMKKLNEFIGGKFPSIRTIQRWQKLPLNSNKVKKEPET